MKVGLGGEGLTINSKKFNPYSFSLKGIEIAVDKAASKTNPLTLLEGLAALKGSDEETTNLDKVKALRTVVNKNI